MTPIPPHTSEAPILSATAAYRFAPYLRLLFLTALALYLLPFAIVRMPHLDRWGESFYERAIDFGFQTAGRNADVVLFGDSSAIHGPDPQRLDAALGLRVLNLPNTVGSLPVTGTLALDHYLLHNTPPRLIVFYFTRWDLDYDRPNPNIFEGEVVLARFGSVPMLWQFIRKHPGDLLRFPLRYYAAEPHGVLIELHQKIDRGAAIRADAGHLGGTGPAMRDGCLLDSSQLRPQSGTAAAALLARYSTPQTRVLFVYAPMPACANLRQLPPLPPLPAVAPLPTLPPADFVDDGRAAHILTFATPAVSDAVANVIRATLNGAPPQNAPADTAPQSGTSAVKARPGNLN